MESGVVSEAPDNWKPALRIPEKKYPTKHEPGLLLAELPRWSRVTF